MVPLPFSPTKLKYYSWHEWLGVTVFLLFWLRLFWRWRHPPPPMLAVGWQLSAAKLGHALLYLLMFLTPISGWLFSSSTGVQTVYLGLIPLPDLIGREAGLNELCKAVHYTCSMSMAAAVVVHVAAALKPHWVIAMKHCGESGVGLDGQRFGLRRRGNESANEQDVLATTGQRKSPSMQAKSPARTNATAQAVEPVLRARLRGVKVALGSLALLLVTVTSGVALVRAQVKAAALDAAKKQPVGQF